MVELCGPLRRGISTKKKPFQQLSCIPSETAYRMTAVFLELFPIQFTLRVSLASQSFMFFLLSHSSSSFHFSSFSSILTMMAVGVTCPIVITACCLQDTRWPLKKCLFSQLSFVQDGFFSYISSLFYVGLVLRQ